MGIACSMSRILQQGCAPPVVADPQNPDPCFLFHADTVHPMTWIVDEVPGDWTMPVTFEYSDGHTEVSNDGTDAHEFALEGSYTIRGTSANGKTCIVQVMVPSA